MDLAVLVVKESSGCKLKTERVEKELKSWRDMRNAMSHTMDGRKEFLTKATERTHLVDSICVHLAEAKQLVTDAKMDGWLQRVVDGVIDRKRRDTNGTRYRS